MGSQRAHLRVIYCDLFSLILAPLSLLVYLRAVSFTQKAAAPFHRPSQPFSALWSTWYRMKTNTLSPSLKHIYKSIHAQPCYTFLLVCTHTRLCTSTRYSNVSDTHTNTHTHTHPRTDYIDIGNCGGFHHEQIIVITFSLETLLSQGMWKMGNWILN